MNNNNKIVENLFLSIMIFLSLVSFFHIADFWSLTNHTPFHYLTAAATELFLITSIFAIRDTKWGWVMFFIGIIAQGFGNIFASYIRIDRGSDIFILYQQLTEGIYKYIITDLTEFTYPRSLALITGLFYVIGQSAVFKTYIIIREKRIALSKIETDEEEASEIDKINTEKNLLSLNIETLNNEILVMKKYYEDQLNTLNIQNDEQKKQNDELVVYINNIINEKTKLDLDTNIGVNFKKSDTYIDNDDLDIIQGVIQDSVDETVDELAEKSLNLITENNVNTTAKIGSGMLKPDRNS